jgi:hypothetical protein
LAQRTIAHAKHGQGCQAQNLIFPAGSQSSVLNFSPHAF